MFSKPPSTSAQPHIRSGHSTLLHFAISWLFAGLVFGIGFSLSTFAVLPLLSWWSTPDPDFSPAIVEPSTEPVVRPMFKRYGPEAKLNLASQHAERGDKEFRILGTIRNDGEDVWDSVTLQATFFNSDGSFRDLCRDYMRAPLHPGREVYFVVRCSKQIKTPVPPTVTYTIEIIDASPQL